jgi:hypothetical protein
MQVDKAEVIATLRARRLGERADWVDQELRLIVDTSKHGTADPSHAQPPCRL